MKKLGTKKLNQDIFLKKCFEIHGYEYEYSQYKNWHTPIDIKCPKHGFFRLTPDSHIKYKKKCQLCQDELKLKAWIDNCNEFHNYKYNYDNVQSINSSNYFSIICPQHGEFKQQSRMHLSQGCPKCAGNIKFKTEDFIFLSKKVHGETFD